MKILCRGRSFINLEENEVCQDRYKENCSVSIYTDIEPGASMQLDSIVFYSLEIIVSMDVMLIIEDSSWTHKEF